MMGAKGLSRRELLKGALAFAGLGAFGARRIFAVPPGWRPSGTRRLSFGVISDSHYYRALDGYRLANGTTDAYVLNALRYFRSRNVDAVMHCGDMAQYGIIDEMRLLADSWFSVFPDSKAPDGHEVVKLFVPGNHDIEGYLYNPDRMVSMYGSSDYRQFLQYLLIDNLAANWKSVWKEDYVEAWHKTVKGYHFFGYNSWNVSDHHDWQQELGASEQALVDLVTEAGGAGLLDGAKPFFLMSHIRQRAAVMTPLASYTNCLGFWGHWHNSCARWDDDELCWREGAAFPRLQCPSLHHKSMGNLPATLSFARSANHQVEGGERGWDNPCYYQGLLVEVYDDAVVIERHDFNVGHNNARIGPDWVMPVAGERYTKANHPFSQTELKKTDRELGAPQFPSGAALAIDERQGSVRITIPNANGNANTRVFIYNVEFSALGQDSFWKSIYATGCDDGAGYERNGGVTVLDVSKWDLPPGRVFAVRAVPVSPLGLEGDPVSATLSVERIRVEIGKDAALPRVAQGRYVLTKDANLPNANNLEFVLPDWVERATVEDGEIVIYTKPAPLSLRIR